MTFMVEKLDMDETTSVLDSNFQNQTVQDEEERSWIEGRKKKRERMTHISFAYQITSFTLVQQLLGKPFCFTIIETKHSKEGGQQNATRFENRVMILKMLEMENEILPSPYGESRPRARTQTHTHKFYVLNISQRNDTTAETYHGS